MFQGSMTALVTPFKDGRVDEDAFQSFVEWQIDEGTEAVIPCGTTGESPTLSHEEHMRVTESCIEAAAGKVPVIAGTGSNSTEEAIMLTRHAKDAGVTAALVVTPYYNKPTQEGLYRHYKAINDAVDLPVLIYNIPGRSVVDMSVDTMARLAKLVNIVGVKDATQDLARPMATRLAIGKDFCQLSGEDATIVPFLAGGGSGCISVTANVVPELMSAFCDCYLNGDRDGAAALDQRLQPIHEILFVETSPTPTKWALEQMGKIDNGIRLPLIPLSEAHHGEVRQRLRAIGAL